MKKIVSNPSVRLNALVIVVLGAGTIVAGATFPWVFVALWAIVVATSTVAVVGAVRSA